MGSVLENGLYLPDEGERNAYDGLKGNWNTLDNLVETVTALSSTGLIRKPVDALPITDIQTNVIYLLKATKPNGDVYRIEYMYIDDHWDPLGTSETTLDDYYTKTETNDLPAVKSGINATKVSNYDTHIADTDIHVSLANKQTWDGKQNALDTAQTAAVNSGITGTKVTGYDTHVSDTDIHVTASDKTAWNSKQDGLSQTQLAAVNSGVNATKVTGYDSHVADANVHVTTADKAAWNGKQDALTQTQLNNIATIPDKANSADLATVATSGSYTDLINAPTIPTVNNATLTIQKNGTDVATFTANASSNVTANLSIPVNTSDLNNDAGFLTQHNPIDDELSATSENALQNKVVKSELDGKAPLVHTHAASDITSGTFNIARIPNLDASKITSGTIDIARLPKGSLERLIKVADQTARYALTTDDVQLGDTVQQLDTGVMYVVTDETKLDSADGYTEFTAGSASSVPWTGVTGKPSSFTPSSHTHGNVTNDGKLPTASRALISDSSKKITVSSVTDTELGYLSGVTSAIQTQLNAKADDSGVVHKTGNETISGTKTFSNSTNVDLSIQKGISSGHCNIRFNDDTGLSRTVIRSYNDKLEIGHLRNANWYDGAEFVLKDDGSSKIKSNDGTVSTEVSFNPDSVKPTNSAIDLGTSSNKWKSVYADAYYLGTTAFGDIVTHNASEFSASNHVHGNITNDGKVGTIANLPLITGTGGAVQAGSFGNQANTFCEGNDSRLSDARTPVAHTHGKADITDLFNSANTWSGENKYTSGFILSNISWSGVTPPSSAKPTVIEFKNSDTRQGRYINRISSTSSETWIETIRNVDANTSYNHTVILKVDNSGNKSVYPSSNNDVDLGIAANQWNNLYAQSYYYNGVAWGLDKANVWSGINTFTAGNYGNKLVLKNTGLDLSNGNSGLTDTYLHFIQWVDNSNTDYAMLQGFTKSANTTTVILNKYRTDANTSVTAELRLENSGTAKSFYSNSNGDTDLGTSSKRWKSFNGINPGALSLPDNSGYANISGNITDLTGSVNSYTPPSDGYVMVNVNPNSNNYAFVSLERVTVRSSSETTSGKNAMATIPVIGGKSIDISVIGASIAQARFTPCLGNV